MKIENKLKKKLHKREITIGSWLQIANPVTAEIMSKSGFEWLVIDLEHSVISLSEAQMLFQIIQAYNVIPLARVSSNDAVQIKRVMDAGSFGVIVPNINSAQDAEYAIESTKYPPWGKRGVGLARAQGFGLEFDEYKKWVNSESVVIVQIEHIDAIENLEEILKVKGVDGSIIGPYDLSASMGFPGEFDKKEVKEAIAKYVSVCQKLKKAAGFHIIPPSFHEVKQKIKQRFSFLAFSIDTLFLAHKLRIEFSKVKKLI